MATRLRDGTGPREALRFHRGSPFFTILGLILLALALAGFWPQYFGAVLGNPVEPATQFWMIHLHAALFVGWLLLYVCQAALIMTGRTRRHVDWGPVIATYGFAIAAIGIFASVLLAHRRGVLANNFEIAASFVFFPLIDMIFFGGFLLVAMLYRKVSDLHKRAMFLATFSIAIVGLGRLVGRLPFDSPWVWQPINLAPLLIALAYDAYYNRRIFPVMAVGLAAHLARLNAEPFAGSDLWRGIGRTIVMSFG